MGFVQRIERKLEATVGDAFARVFGGSIVSQEVEAALRREAGDGVQTLEGGHLLAPNEYVLTLSEPDFAKAVADPELTTDTFAKHLVGYIQDQGWQTYGDVVVRFEQSPKLHTGQFRARAAVNPDATPTPPPQLSHALNAEQGVAPMTDNPSYRSGQGQGRPADDYYDERYGRGPDDQQPPAGPPADPRGAYPPDQGGYPEQGGYPPQGNQPYPPRGGYPEQGGYPDQGGGYPEQGGGYPEQGGYPPQYEQQRPPAGGYGGPPPGYDQPSYRQPPAAPPAGPGYGGQQGYPPQGPEYGDYGRPPGPPPARHEGPAAYGRPEPRPGYGEYEQQGGYPPQQGQQYAQPEYGQPDYGRYDAPPAEYGAPTGSDYDYGQGGYPAGGGYGPNDYGPPGHSTVTLHLDDGSGRTYQLREGANVIGRGQDAQFRLPDTGVSRRHLEIRWDGQTALLSDLNSTNGTTVNNAPVQEWQLADGDVIRLGHSEIVVRMH